MQSLVQEGRLHGDNPSEEPQDDPLDRPAAEPPEPAGEPPAPPEERDEPEPQAGPRSQVRPYVVIEQQKFEDDDAPYFVVVGTYRARNGEAAKRKAFKEHVRDDQPHLFISVPASQWTITPVRRAHRSIESVQVG